MDKILETIGSTLSLPVAHEQIKLLTLEKTHLTGLVADYLRENENLKSQTQVLQSQLESQKQQIETLQKALDACHSNTPNPKVIKQSRSWSGRT